PAAMHAAYTWAIAEALEHAGIEIPFPQTDLRIRSLFGREGDEALEAMTTGKAPTPRPAARKPKRAATSRASDNDAAEDLMQQSAAEAPEPGNS
ncbi:MAG: transporter, partial [Brevundimonas sp.]